MLRSGHIPTVRWIALSAVWFGRRVRHRYWRGVDGHERMIPAPFHCEQVALTCGGLSSLV
jgi:hypothetical protein